MGKYSILYVKVMKITPRSYLFLVTSIIISIANKHQASGVTVLDWIFLAWTVD